ncbi:MAG: hypothetical protein QNJ97_17315 [Myxococcota bacterium]|nr:hypothetical protein [Myxococcota bacterium]
MSNGNCIKQYLWLIYSVALAAGSIGCIEDLTFSSESHICRDCRDCERCVIYTNVDNNSVDHECVPADLRAYTKCGTDGNVYWYDSCDNIGKKPARLCPQNSHCAQLSTTEAVCECIHEWTGYSCNNCPGNWDPDKNCAQCIDGWDPDKNCAQCLENWDSQTDCKSCLTYWDITTDCTSCLGNRDPDKNCEDCLGNWDLGKNCTECRNGWTGDNCEICPDGWDPDQDCIEVCGNGQITESEECDDSNVISWDGCNACNIGEFQVNTYTLGVQGIPDVAIASDGRFLVVWESDGQDGSESGIFGQRFDVSGYPEGDEFQVNTYTADAQKRPAVAMTPDGAFVVVWESDGQDGSDTGIFGQRFNNSGEPEGNEFQINTYATSNQQNPAVAMASDGRFVVVWDSADQDAIANDVFGRRFDENGDPLESEFQVNAYTDDEQQHPAVAMASDGRFLVVWGSKGQDGSGYRVLGQRFDANGNLDDVEIQLNEQTASRQQRPTVAMASDGIFVVAWESFNVVSNKGYEVLAQRFNENASPIGSEFRVNSFNHLDQDHPSAAMAGNGLSIIVWQSIYRSSVRGQRYDQVGSVNGYNFTINTYELAIQDSPAAAMAADGRFVVVWQSGSQDGSDAGIFAQRYDAAGNPLGVLPWPGD